MNASSGPEEPDSSSAGPAAARRPSLSNAQIGDWFRTGAHDALRGYPPGDEKRLSGGKGGSLAVPAEILRRIKEARRSLERAEAKNAVKIIKPLRSLRRDQSAVNEALIDSIRSLLTINREMSHVLERVRQKLDNLETRFADQPIKPPPQADGPERQ